jgi:hypothetical protein
MDTNPEHWKPDIRPMSLFNPLNHEVMIERYNDHNELENTAIPPISAATFPAHIAIYLKRHLVDIIINERRLGLVTPEIRATIEAEVTV